MERAGPGWLPPKEQSFEVEPAWDALAEALAGRLQAVAPIGIFVRAAPNAVAFSHADTPGWALTRLKLSPGDRIEDPRTLERACEGVLSSFQDLAAEETTDPWPARGGAQPQPEVEVDEATVRLWYGDRSSPALSFDPIEREALR